jgi:hypothetical protein
MTIKGMGIYRVLRYFARRPRLVKQQALGCVEADVEMDVDVDVDATLDQEDMQMQPKWSTMKQ